MLHGVTISNGAAPQRKDTKMIKTLALVAAGYVGVYMMFCAIAGIGGHLMSQPYTFTEGGYTITVTSSFD
jgi:hypothetical protein